MFYFKKNILFLTIILLLSCLFSCDDTTVKSNCDINPNIVKLDIPSTNNFVAVWHGNDIYSVTPPYYFKINDSYEVTEVRELPIPFGNWTYIEINEAGTKLLLVKSTYRDISSGFLYEFDIQSEQLILLKDSTHNVSTAVYWHGDDNRIIYYKYGDPVGTEPGYYIYNKLTNEDTLLLSYISPGGPAELINGFDLHPNNDRLLIPLCQSTLLDAKPPKLGIYTFGSNKIDTLSLEFDFSFIRIGIWVRYNNDGSKILYCVYPKGAYTETTNDNSEVGIIEYPSLKKNILNVNTNTRAFCESVQLAPNWNQDFQSIIYGSGMLFLEGAIGRRELFILKQFN